MTSSLWFPPLCEREDSRNTASVSSGCSSHATVRKDGFLPPSLCSETPTACLLGWCHDSSPGATASVLSCKRLPSQNQGKGYPSCQPAAPPSAHFYFNCSDFNCSQNRPPSPLVIFPGRHLQRSSRSLRQPNLLALILFSEQISFTFEQTPPQLRRYYYFLVIFLSF